MSESVAGAMAEGVVARTGASLGVAVTSYRARVLTSPARTSGHSLRDQRRRRDLASRGWSRGRARVAAVATHGPPHRVGLARRSRPREFHRGPRPRGRRPHLSRIRNANHVEERTQSPQAARSCHHLALSTIEKQFGKGSIMRLNADGKLPGRDVPVVPTGALDSTSPSDRRAPSRPHHRDLRTRVVWKDDADPARHRRGSEAEGVCAFMTLSTRWTWATRASSAC